jgi:hypothetical protein
MRVRSHIPMVIWRALEILQRHLPNFATAHGAIRP